MSEKPVIFISHSSRDDKLVTLIKRQLKLCFQDELDIFASDIHSGENWFDKIMAKLDRADALVLLITPNSTDHSHWVWFELGYFWSKRAKKIKNEIAKRRGFYPLIIDGTNVPNPVVDLHIQYTSLNDVIALKSFINELIKQFKVGEITLFDVDEIVAEVTSLKNEVYTVMTSDNPDQRFARGVSREKLDDYLYAQYALHKGIDPNLNYSIQRSLTRNRRGFSIFTGKIVDYEALDRELNLYPGTSAIHLKALAKQYGLAPISGREHEDCIRFLYDSELDAYLTQKQENEENSLDTD